MVTVLRIGIVALIALMHGCLAPDVFPCRSNAECVRGGFQGRCILGSCAFPDASCPKGMRWDTTAQAKTGECLCSTDFSSDPVNCGGCDKICLRPSHAADSACVDSECAIGSCATGYLDCDGQYENGCEANLTNSDLQVGAAIDHCGACGKTCPLPAYATATSCQASTCKITTCAEGYVDCDRAYDNGCECDSGVCSGSACAAPSCNDLVKNGSETDVDCGGANSCGRCNVGKRCSSSGDCQSKYCNSSRVCAPFCESCGTNFCCGTFCCASFTGGCCSNSCKISNNPRGSTCSFNESCASCSCNIPDPINHPFEGYCN